MPLRSDVRVGEVNSGEIRKLLKRYGVDFSSWGTGIFKSVEDLAYEIAEGETVLLQTDEGELLRTVEVINIIVEHTNMYGRRFRLVEDRQIYRDGTERKRDFLGPVSVSEKKKTSENIETALYRAIKEELGIDDGFKIVEGPSTERVRKVAASFPNLKCEFTIYRFSIDIDDSSYVSTGYVENDGFKTTYFIWIELEC